MDAWVWIIVAILVLLLLGTVIGRRAAGGVDPTQLLLDPELVGRVRKLAQANQKIAAIRLLRESNPGLGLAAAKVMVDRMAAPPASPVQTQTADHRTARPDLGKSEPVAGAGLTPSASALPLEVELQVRSLKSADQKISAIKLVREHTGWGLREAKDFVEQL
ncbi:ribosomal protein L7/L12 [Nakamurella sp. UYEF19]|uniref:ribosomal protein L7/L12 n=1 Tax=Nakamurella sp. UYEF19 TaxID=1756392 RepID=UPI003393AB57